MDFFTLYEKERNRRKQAENLDFARMQADWQGLFFDSERGMRVLGDMLTFCDFFGTSFTGNSTTFFNEGLKYFITMIIDLAGLDNPQGLVKIAQLRAAGQQRRAAQSFYSTQDEKEETDDQF
ncbi:MAG: hypothetical protein QMD09_14465 [Desulfatibacillaceae bacterium]|nr:hypothetical protein [Desulfatibacillaceae bacterium]